MNLSDIEKKARYWNYWKAEMTKGKATVCPMCGELTKSKSGFCKGCYNKR